MGDNNRSKSSRNICRNQGMEVADPKESIRSVSCVVIGIVENKSLASCIAVEGSSTIST